MTKINKIFTACLLMLAMPFRLMADEGMWIPLLLQQLNEAEMKSMGMKISAEDIYSVNNSSLKDAIVLFGRGCTGEVISEEGLIITNHHCGYGAIANHSTVSNDYLTDGFWAMNRKDELANPNLTVSFLVRMENVTERVLKNVTNSMTEEMRNFTININSNAVIKEATKDNNYRAVVSPYFEGNEYYLLVYETFRDVRLVGAPPSSIGKFGGDTDNWMWPRHTGDFALFRIYANKNNEPAEYSPDNVPYKPKKVLTISTKGYNKGDFTMVYGFPGRTTEYLTSYAVEMIYRTENPANIKIREKKLAIMHAEMKQNDTARINYSNRYVGIANYWKKWLGENNGLRKLNAIDKKRALEERFVQWIAADNARKQYENLLPFAQKTYADFTPVNLAFDSYREAIFGIEIFGFAKRFQELVELSKNPKGNKDKIEAQKQKLMQATESFYKSYSPIIDKNMLAAMIKIFYQQVPTDFQPDITEFITKNYQKDYVAYANYIFTNSIFANKQNLLLFLKKYKPKQSSKIEKDPAYMAMLSFNSCYEKKVLPHYRQFNTTIDSLNRVYMKGLMEMDKDKRFYPDANSTLRVAYGKVDDYKPRDAVKYNYYTTLEGKLQKEDAEIEDYQVPAKLKELYNKKDYGNYAVNGEMRIAFTASNHTTGGNSGSPVLNANGELIGVNFDRNWEGTMSDIMYDPTQCRNIALDIRYALFIIDKFAGASHLIKEMKIATE